MPPFSLTRAGLQWCPETTPGHLSAHPIYPGSALQGPAEGCSGGAPEKEGGSRGVEVLTCPLVLTWLPSPGELQTLVRSGFPACVTGRVSVDPRAGMQAAAITKRAESREGPTQHPLGVTTS